MYCPQLTTPNHISRKNALKHGPVLLQFTLQLFPLTHATFDTYIHTCWYINMNFKNALKHGPVLVQFALHWGDAASSLLKAHRCNASSSLSSSSSSPPSSSANLSHNMNYMNRLYKHNSWRISDKFSTNQKFHQLGPGSFLYLGWTQKGISILPTLIFLSLSKGSYKKWFWTGAR